MDVSALALGMLASLLKEDQLADALAKLSAALEDKQLDGPLAPLAAAEALQALQEERAKRQVTKPLQQTVRPACVAADNTMSGLVED